MLSVNMYSLWKDDTSNIIKGIGEATNNIVNYRHSLNVTEKGSANLSKMFRQFVTFGLEIHMLVFPRKQQKKRHFKNSFLS